MRADTLLLAPAPSFSFEFFPPKTPEGLQKLYARIEHLAELRPGFVSVTYGAGGSTRLKTVEMAGHIRNELGVEVVAHLTCLGHTRDELARLLDELVSVGVENVLLLRGDAGPNVGQGELHYAVDLIRLARERHPHLCIGAACYPETHTEATDADADLRYLKEKVDAGTDFLVTQLFFENRYYFDFLRRARSVGIEVPVLPGLMPVTDLAQVRRFTQMCGATLPPQLTTRLEKWTDDQQAVMALGIEWAIRQGRELLTLGAPGVHFYTLNRSLATRVVHLSLSGVSGFA